MVHVPGLKNVVAYALSRPSPEPEPVSKPTASSLVSTCLTPTPSALPPLILSNPILSAYNFRHLSTLRPSCASVFEMRSSPSLSLVSIPLGASSLLCDVSSGSPSELLELLHSSSHPGIGASRRLLSTRFVWPGLSQDVGLWARSSLRCQRSKIQIHVHASSHGFTNLLTMIDRTS